MQSGRRGLKIVLVPRFHGEGNEHYINYSCIVTVSVSGNEKRVQRLFSDMVTDRLHSSSPVIIAKNMNGVRDFPFSFQFHPNPKRYVTIPQSYFDVAIIVSSLSHHLYVLKFLIYMYHMNLARN